MPELPEVETVRRSLLKLLPNKSIAQVQLFKPQIVAVGDVAALCGQQFAAFDRRGKYLIFTMSDGARLVVHLRMTGKLLYHADEQPLQKHDHLRIAFADGSELIYNDTRAFGRLWLTDAVGLADISGLATLGLEPLDDDFNAAYWHNRVKRRANTQVKAALLDQHIVAGLGNIYADEVLFRAGINPARKVGSLTPVDDERLVLAMRDILTEAIANRGTTFRDYVDGNNQKGGYQNLLKVFQKNGEPCPVCGTPIERVRVCGRGTHYCPSCQPEVQ